MTYNDIEARVERRVRDFANFEWNKSEISDYINDGYKEFAMLTHCLKKHDTTLVVAGTSLYNVPSDNIRILRGEWNGKSVSVLSTDEMDFQYGGTDWRTHTGTYARYIIQDAEGAPQIRIYPILEFPGYTGNFVTGTDGNVYRCILAHTSAAANDKPTTGSNYATYWATYTAGGIPSVWADTTAYTLYQEVSSWSGHVITGTDSNSYECILNHTSASANRPITGADWATYWVAYSGSKTATTWVTGRNYFENIELDLDYAYLPATLTGTTEAVIPAKYHKALVDYAINECLRTEVQSNQDPVMGSTYWNNYMNYVKMCKNEMNTKVSMSKRPIIHGPRNFA